MNASVILTAAVLVFALVALAAWTYGRFYAMPAGAAGAAAWVDPVEIMGSSLVAFTLLLIFTPPTW